MRVGRRSRQGLQGWGTALCIRSVILSHLLRIRCHFFPSRHENSSALTESKAFGEQHALQVDDRHSDLLHSRLPGPSKPSHRSGAQSTGQAEVGLTLQVALVFGVSHFLSRLSSPPRPGHLAGDSSPPAGVKGQGSAW